MAWTTPRTWVAGEVVTASQLNAHVRDNLNFLLNGRILSYIVRAGSSDYTTTSTSFTPVDTTNLRITATPNSGRVVLVATGHWKHSSSTGKLYGDFILDAAGAATRVGGTDGLALQVMSSVGAAWPFMLIGLFTGLSVASHTFDLAWKTDSNTATMENNPSPIVFGALEM